MRAHHNVGPAKGDLVEMARAGDRAAFAALMRVYEGRVMAVVNALMGDAERSRDVAQDVWLKVWRFLPRYDGRSSFATWLHVVARNEALEVFRRARSRPTWDADVDGLEIAADSCPPDPLLRRVIERAVGELPPAKREVWLRRELDGDSMKDLARATGSPEGTVLTRLHHARRILQERLKGER